jgi:hypothetical protein
MDHTAPSHRSTRPEEPTEGPTAVHAVGAEQDTLASELCVLPEGIGVGWIVQAVPFQPSASGAWYMPGLE